MIVADKGKTGYKCERYKELILSSVPPEGILFIDLIKKVVKKLEITSDRERENMEATIDDCITFFVTQRELHWGDALRIFKGPSPI